MAASGGCTIFFPGNAPAKLTKWKIKAGYRISKGSLLALYTFEDVTGVHKLKSHEIGIVEELLISEGGTVSPGVALIKVKECDHPVVMKDMCAECGADLRERYGRAGDRKEQATASVAMVHSIPELTVSEAEAIEIGHADEERLLTSKKLVLLVDLDQTLLHTTNDNVPQNLKDVVHFQLWHGTNQLWYHTKLRPGTKKFLEKIATMYELHICTFGVRMYAHTIASHLDPEGKLFSHRILSRDECFDHQSKTANLKALFPCGDVMVCIIDDREDVWNFAPNLIHVKPYRFFQGTADINAPPGLDKTDDVSAEIKADSALHHKEAADKEGQASVENQGDVSEKLPGDVSEKLPEISGDISEKLPETSGDIGEKLPETSGDISEKLPETSGDISEKLPETSGDISEKLPETSGDIGEKLPETSGEMSEKLSETSGDISEKLPEQNEERAVSIENMETDEHSKESENKGNDLENKGSGLESKESELEDKGTDLEKQGKDLESKGIDLEYKETDFENMETNEKRGTDIVSTPSDIYVDTAAKLSSDGDNLSEAAAEGLDDIVLSDSEEEDVTGSDVKVNISGDKLGSLDKPSSLESSKDDSDELDSGSGDSKGGNSKGAEKGRNGSENLVSEKNMQGADLKYEAPKTVDVIEWDDDDDYLFYLEDILTKIHQAYYKMHDESKSKGTTEVPDLKNIIPYVKRKVLKGVNLVFSCVIPRNIPQEKSKEYQIAKSLGANIQDTIVMPTGRNDSSGTTHLVAAKVGTAKVNQVSRNKYIQVVTPDWLWCCYHRWERVTEKLFHLTNETSIMSRDSPAPKARPLTEKRKRADDDDAIFSEKRTKVDESEEDEDRPKKIAKVDRAFRESVSMFALSKEELAEMDKEVDDIISGDDEFISSASSEDEEEELDDKLRKRVLGEDSDSSSGESLDVDFPRGWKRLHSPPQRITPDDTEDSQELQEEGPSVEDRRRQIDIAVNASDSDTNDGQYCESIGSVDEEMAEAVEKEFLSY